MTGRVRQPGFVVDPNAGFRPGRYNACMGHHEGHGYSYDGAPMSVPCSDPTCLAVSQSKMDMAREPSQMSSSSSSSSSESPASPSDFDSPAECLLPSASASGSGPRAGSRRAPVPLFYDYTEGFVEEEFFVANGSIPSLSSQGSMANGPQQHAESHAQMAPRDPAAFFRDVSARIAALSMEGTLRPIELETSSLGTMPSAEEGSSRGESERPLVAEEDPSPGPSTSTRKGSDLSISSFGTHLRLDRYPCDKQAPTSPVSNSAGVPRGTDGSPEPSGDWEAAVESANKISYRDLGLSSAASSSSSASGGPSRGDELDLADGTPSEIAWREANLGAECRGGTLAKLNTLGRQARDSRQANLPSLPATRGGLAVDGDEEESGRCVEQHALPKLIVDPRHGGSATTTTTTSTTVITTATTETTRTTAASSSSGTKPSTTRAATALLMTENEAPALLSKRSFPSLHKEVGAGTATSSQRSLVSPMHPMPPLPNSPSTDARSRPVRMDGTGPAFGLGIHHDAVVSLVPGQGGGVAAPYKVKLRMQRSCAGQSTTSAELRPWNIDDNYPWTSTALDVHVGTPELATRLQPPPAKPRRFKLRMPRKWSLTQKRCLKSDDAVQKAALAGEPTLASSLSKPEARQHLGVRLEGVSFLNDDANDFNDAPCFLAGSVTDTPPKVFGDGSAAPVGRGSENDAPLSPSTMLARSISPVELRSVFSSDSSDDDGDDGRQRPRQRRDGRPSRVRDRFSSLRARFAASRAGNDVGVSAPATDGDPRGSCQTVTSAPSHTSREALSRHCHHPLPRRASASPSGGHPTSNGPRHASNILRHRTWRVVAGRLRRWVARRREQVSRLRRRNAVAL